MGPRLASWIWVKSNWNTTGLIFHPASRDRLGIDEYFWSYAWAQSEMNLRISRECLWGKNSNMGFSAQKVGCSTHWKPFTGDNAVISSARRPGPRFLSLFSTSIHPSIHPEVNFINPPKKSYIHRLSGPLPQDYTASRRTEWDRTNRFLLPSMRPAFLHSWQRCKDATNLFFICPVVQSTHLNSMKASLVPWVGAVTQHSCLMSRLVVSQKSESLISKDRTSAHRLFVGVKGSKHRL